MRYDALDKTPLTGVSFYRLKQVDFDGQLDYSAIVTLDNNDRTSLDVFPNPASDKITITGQNIDLSSLSIFNAMGQNVTTKAIIDYADSDQIVIDIAQLDVSIYYIKTAQETTKLYKR